jgi:hypothetical protein
VKFEESAHAKNIAYKKIELEFGNFFFCEKFVIGEISEDIDYSWDKIETVAMLIVEYYGSKPKIGYISNRINSYSNDPRLWTQFHDTYDLIIANAIVSYTKFSHLNADIEKLLTSKSTKRCFSLDEAIDWMLNLEEFKS